MWVLHPSACVGKAVQIAQPFKIDVAAAEAFGAKTMRKAEGDVVQRERKVLGALP